MWKPKNLVDTLVPINILHVIFCHGVVQYPTINKPKIKYSLVWSILSTILYCIGFFFVFCLRVNSSWFASSRVAVYIILVLAVFFTMIVNIVIGWVYNNDIMILYSKLIKSDDLLKNLGVSMNIQREYVTSMKFVVGWIIHSLFINAVAMIWYDKSSGMLIVAIVVFTFHHAFHVNDLIDLKFFLLIKHMRVRFEGVNQLLSDVNSLQTNNLPETVEADYKWAIKRQINLEKDFTKIFRVIKRSHLELKSSCNKIMKIYGVSISLTIILMFFLLVALLFNLYMAVMYSEKELTDKLISISTMIIWILVAGLKFFSINYICAKTIQEWDKTGEIIHKLDVDSEDPEFQKEIQKFSIQILQNPLKFTPCGFYDLGYYFLKDFVASVAAQLIILIQTSPYNNSSHAKI